MRKIFLCVVFLFAFVSWAGATTEDICEHVAALNGTAHSYFVLKDICNGTEFLIHIPKGTTSLSLYFQNIRQEYCCLGPEIEAVLSDDSSVSFSSATGVGNTISWYYDSITGFSSPAGINLGDTFSMDSGGGYSLAIYISSTGSDGLDKEYYLKFKAKTHIDSISIELDVNATNFDAGDCAGIDPPSSDIESFNCPASDECPECSSTGASNPMGTSGGKPYGSSSGRTSGSTSGSTSGGTTGGTKECHWVQTACGLYRLVCTTTGGSVPPPPPSGGCDSCQGTTYPPFNLSPRPVQTSTPQQSSESETVSWFRNFFSQRNPYRGGSSSTSGSTGSGSSGVTLSGIHKMPCTGGCLSDPSIPKFYTNESTYLFGDTISAAIYVPKYTSPVDVYAAVEDPSGKYWILTPTGAVLYSGGEVSAYATGVNQSVAVAFYLNELIPLQEGVYTLYILVVPAGADLNNLKEYTLVYYQFEIQTK